MKKFQQNEKHVVYKFSGLNGKLLEGKKLTSVGPEYTQVTKSVLAELSKYPEFTGRTISNVEIALRYINSPARPPDTRRLICHFVCCNDAHKTFNVIFHAHGKSDVIVDMYDRNNEGKAKSSRDTVCHTIKRGEFLVVPPTKNCTAVAIRSSSPVTVFEIGLEIGTNGAETCTHRLPPETVTYTTRNRISIAPQSTRPNSFVWQNKEYEVPTSAESTSLSARLCGSDGLLLSPSTSTMNEDCNDATEDLSYTPSPESS